MINYDPTVVKYLAKIASFIKEAALYDIKGRKISSENHMIPTIINEIQTCFFYKI